jgi:AcrR family transcriptional regulator
MANEELKMQNIELSLKTAAGLYMKYGPNNTTKSLIAKESGLSRRTIERYFKSEMDCVMQTTNWISKNMHSHMFAYSDEIFDNGERTAADILELYLRETKKLFDAEPRMFILYTEVKTYIYRNSDNTDRDFETFSDLLGVRSLVRRIFKKGSEDGSLLIKTDYLTASESFYTTMIYYYADVTLKYKNEPQKASVAIDEYIENMLWIYCM